jgi:hypothetical protein
VTCKNLCSKYGDINMVSLKFATLGHLYEKDLLNKLQCMKVKSSIYICDPSQHNDK